VKQKHLWTYVIKKVLVASGASGILAASEGVCDLIVAISCLQAAIFIALVHACCWTGLADAKPSIEKRRAEENMIAES
jgi:hypothetical protein